MFLNSFFRKQKSAQNRSKNGFEDEMHPGIGFSKILMDSGRQAGAMWAPGRSKTPQLRVQDGPEAAQEAPQTIQVPPKSCPRGVQEAVHRCFGARNRPRAPREPPKGRPDFLQTSILDRFWRFFGAFEITGPVVAPYIFNSQVGNIWSISG